MKAMQDQVNNQIRKSTIIIEENAGVYVRPLNIKKAFDAILNQAPTATPICVVLVPLQSLNAANGKVIEQ